MSKIHYFQRYHSEENFITNSTLLLLSRLYHYNRQKFETIINNILGETIELNIGVQFTQQEWGTKSVIDGIISQNSFKIGIETKLYDNFSIDQLKRHLDLFSDDYNKKILLALSKNNVNAKIKKETFEILENKKYKGIQFASTTYKDIYETIMSSLDDYEYEMIEILEDYYSLCKEHDLIDIETSTMLAFTAGTSFVENLKYRIYYDPATRNHNVHYKYIGLYSNKSIKAIGELKKTIYCDYENGKLVATGEYDLNKLTEEEYNRIVEIIKNTSYYDLRHGVKFLLVDEFYRTDFKKTSFSSLRSKKYFSLEDIEGFNENMNAEQLAKFLDGKTWE